MIGQGACLVPLARESHGTGVTAGARVIMSDTVVGVARSRPSGTRV